MHMKKLHDYKFLIKYVRYRLREKQKFIVLLILPKVFATNMNAQVGVLHLVLIFFFFQNCSLKKSIFIINFVRYNGILFDTLKGLKVEDNIITNAKLDIYISKN